MTDVDRSKFCKHYHGLSVLFGTKGQCDAGLNCREVTGGPGAGWLMRSPCINRNEVEKPCAKFEQYTEEELAQRKAESDAAFERMKRSLLLAMELKKQHPRGHAGTTECPCCKGTLHFRISSYNGHIHMTCETAKCLNVME